MAPTVSALPKVNTIYTRSNSRLYAHNVSYTRFNLHDQCAVLLKVSDFAYAVIALRIIGRREHNLITVYPATGQQKQNDVGIIGRTLST